MTKQVTLYSYWRSSSAWRVRVALALKGVEYIYVAVPLLKAEQSSEEYSKLNPMQQVPCLVVKEDGKDDVVISQSLAIIDYIDNTFEGPSLYPKDPVARAIALELALDVVSGIQPIQNLNILKAIEELTNADEKTAWARKWISKGLAALEAKAARYVATHPDSVYLCGATPTVADACLVPQLYNARRFNIDVAQYPRLLQCEAAVAELKEFKAAHPDNQPDAVL